MPQVDSEFLLQLTAIIAVCLVIWNQACQALGKNKTPQPLMMQMEKEFCTLEQYEEHVKQVNGCFKHATDSRKQLYGELDRLKTEAARINAVQEAAADSVALLSADFREFRALMNRNQTEILNRLPRVK